MTAEIGAKDKAVLALADMVTQFAYRSTYRRSVAFDNGGLSALEYAFGVLEDAGCKVQKNGMILEKDLLDFIISYEKGAMLYAGAIGFATEGDIYPLTICKDRYGGCYSKGEYTAWNLDPSEVPTESYEAGDVDCWYFWEHNNIPCGLGDSPEEAVCNLIKKVTQEDGHED